MKRFHCILWLALLLPVPAQAFNPCLEEDRQGYAPVELRYESGLLFRIERCGAAPSYIFGTIHSDSARVWRAAGSAADILSRAGSAGFEFIPPPDADSLTAKYMYLPPDARHGLGDIIGEASYRRLDAALSARKLAAPGNASGMKPWAAAVLLQMPPPAGDGIILDERLQRLAGKSGAELYGLESMEEQLSLFDGLPARQQVTMLIEALNGMAETDAMNAALEELYLKGDLRAIEELGRRSLENTRDPQLRRFFESDLLVKRNIAMTRHMQGRLQQGNTMIAVGALHLPGNKGILALLEKLGYFVFVGEEE